MIVAESLWGGGVNEESIPTIKATDGRGNSTVYYLDDLIEDGDSVTTSNGVITSIEKRIHNNVASAEITLNLPTYYSGLCESEINSIISTYIYKDEEDIKNIIKNRIPIYMISGEGYTTEPNVQVTIPTNIGDRKVKVVTQNVLDAARNAAEAYGYSLTNPSSTDNITITKKQE